MTTINNKISCIIPTFNRWDLLYYRLLEIQYFSKLATQEVEVIVVDDHSEVEAPEKVKSLIRSNDWVLTRLHKNSGCTSIPRNIGISVSSGEFIMHIDDDVIILNSKFSVLPSKLHKEIDLAYGGMISRRTNSDIRYSFIPDYKPQTHGYGIDNSQIIYRRSVYDSMPLHFSKRACDWVLISKICEIGKIQGFNLPVSQYIYHGKNRSHSKVFSDINPTDYSEYFEGTNFKVDYSVISGVPEGK